MRKLAALLSVCVTVSGTAPVVAQTAPTYRIDLLLTSGDSPPSYSDDRGRTWSPLPNSKAPLRVKISSDAHGYVYVDDYNPAFFIYKDTSGSSPIPDVAAVQSLASALGTAFGTSKATAGAAIPAGAAPAGPKVAPVACIAQLDGVSLDDLDTDIGNAQNFLSVTLRTKVLHPLSAPETVKVDPAVSPSVQLRRVAQQVKDSLTNDTTISAQLLSLSSLSKSLAAITTPKTATLSCSNDSDTHRTLRSGPSGAAKGIQELIAQILGQSYAPNVTDIANKLEEISILLSDNNKNFDQTLTAIATDMKSLQSDLDSLGVPHEIAGDVTFDAANISTRAVSISWNTKYDALFVAAGDEADRSASQQKAAKYASYEVDFPPYQSYHFGLSVAAVYSFVRNPTYSVQTSNGQLTIAQSSADYNKVTAAVALNITPDRVFNQFGQPHFEIGIVPDTAKFGIFSGVGITFLPVSSNKSASSGSSSQTFQGLEFNVGVMYQKVNELGPGLAVGKVVTSTQALVVNTVLKTGLYVGVGLKIK